jgi:hypothetical protein
MNEITVPPQVAPVTIGSEPANWGEQVSATCNVLKGDNPIEIKWTLNGKPIKPKTHPDITITRSGKKISFLVIDSVSAHHAGEYICIVSNLAGSFSRAAILAVNGTCQRTKYNTRMSFVLILYYCFTYKCTTFMNTINSQIQNVLLAI